MIQSAKPSNEAPGHCGSDAVEGGLVDWGDGLALLTEIVDIDPEEQGALHEKLAHVFGGGFQGLAHALMVAETTAQTIMFLVNKVTGRNLGFSNSLSNNCKSIVSEKALRTAPLPRRMTEVLEHRTRVRL